MSNSTQFPIVRQRMTRKDWGVVWCGNNRPQPEGCVDGWDPQEIAVVKDHWDDRDLFEDLTHSRFIVSAKFQAVLRAFVPDRVQLLPLRLQSVDGSCEWQGFAVANFLSWIPLHIAEANGREFDVFRTPDYAGNFRVTTALQKEIRKARLKGIEFS